MYSKEVSNWRIKMTPLLPVMNQRVCLEHFQISGYFCHAYTSDAVVPWTIGKWLSCSSKTDCQGSVKFLLNRLKPFSSFWIITVSSGWMVSYSCWVGYWNVDKLVVVCLHEYTTTWLSSLRLEVHVIRVDLFACKSFSSAEKFSPTTRCIFLITYPIQHH